MVRDARRASSNFIRRLFLPREEMSYAAEKKPAYRSGRLVARGTQLVATEG
jgi:hypothetical protein